jgi:hypothetical protein
MVKSLQKWVGRQTTLTIGKRRPNVPDGEIIPGTEREVYEGKLQVSTRKIIDRNGQARTYHRYYFLTKQGERIYLARRGPSGKRNVFVIKDGGLGLDINQSS